MFSVYNTIVLRPRYQGICLSACFLYLLLGTQRLLYLIGQIKSLEMMLVSCTSFFFFGCSLSFRISVLFYICPATPVIFLEKYI
jgi:hypothetical protein